MRDESVTYQTRADLLHVGLNLLEGLVLLLLAGLLDIVGLLGRGGCGGSDRHDISAMKWMKKR
jgi:hypothetical protein